MDIPKSLRSHAKGNAAHLFEATAERRGDEVAIEMDGREYTYDALNNHATKFAGRLHNRGFELGAPVFFERDLDETAMQPYTPETTGGPKGVCMSI